LEDIVSLIFGKQTCVFKNNEELESWLCFSIVLKTRTLDFYLSEDTSNQIILAISYACLMINGQLINKRLSSGGYFWAKLEHLIRELVQLKSNDLRIPKNSAKHMSFVKLLGSYNKLQRSLYTRGHNLK